MPIVSITLTGRREKETCMKTKLQIMDGTGHTTLEITDETRAEAQRLFEKCLGNGGAAYRMDAPGKGTQIKSFGQTKDAPEVILRPQLVGG